MKKLFLAIAIAIGLGSAVAVAANSHTPNMEMKSVASEFTSIETSALPDAVKETIAKNYANLTIKEAAVSTQDEGQKIYKVTFIDSEGNTSSILFTGNGEVINS